MQEIRVPEQATWRHKKALLFGFCSMFAMDAMQLVLWLIQDCGYRNRTLDGTLLPRMKSFNNGSIQLERTAYFLCFTSLCFLTRLLPPSFSLCFFCSTGIGHSCCDDQPVVSVQLRCMCMGT